MTIETTAGAFAALATLVVGADRLGSEEERSFLFGRMSRLEVFEGMGRDDLVKLMADTTEQVWTSFPTTEGGRITEDGVASLLGIISGTLTPELKREAFRMAVDLARADGMVLEEQQLLERLRDELGVDPEAAREMLGDEV